MIGQRIGYIRVSTTEQNTERQLDNIKLDRTFIEKASGKDKNRPELEALMAINYKSSSSLYLSVNATGVVCLSVKL